jgi:hypothetical protein
MYHISSIWDNEKEVTCMSGGYIERGRVLVRRQMEQRKVNKLIGNET